MFWSDSPLKTIAQLKNLFAIGNLLNKKSFPFSLERIFQFRRTFLHQFYEVLFQKSRFRSDSTNMWLVSVISFTSKSFLSFFGNKTFKEIPNKIQHPYPVSNIKRYKTFTETGPLKHNALITNILSFKPRMVLSSIKEKINFCS